MKKQIILPFSGFYEALHDSAIDDAFTKMFEYDNGDTNTDLLNRAWGRVNFRHTFEKYAEAYAESFAHEFEFKTLEFESLQSPKFYNFTTDHIFCTIESAECEVMFTATDKARLSEVCAEMFTSRDGFASFYSPNWGNWGEVYTWDHNQLSALLRAFIPADFDQWRECDIVEDVIGNGYLDDWILKSNPDVLRMVNIADYLRRRAERATK